MPTSVAIQGIKGCFHEMAARKFFGGEDLNPAECHSFKDLCLAVQKGHADYGAMAIENTLAGSLLPNYALIEKYGLFIIGEVYLPIRMHLMGVSGTRISGIRSVMSHPVALAQCDEFLENLEGVRIIEYHDTAAAAKYVAEKSDSSIAAISSRLSAELYQLEILEESIETHKENFTRFLILSSRQREEESDNKASLSLVLAHRPGSLADVLQVFKARDVNLTKIQSLPIIGKPYQYAFKMDVTWTARRHFDESLEKIRSMGNRVEVYGIYREQDYQRD